MRPVLGCSLVFFLVFPALVAGAETVSKETVADRFDTVSYSGSNGSVDWSGPWVEEGEGDGPGSGQVSVGDGECAAGKCLRMSGGLLSGVGINRAADLGRFLDASLHYFLHIDPALLSTGSLYVQVRGNGSEWRTVARYSMLTESGTHHGAIDVSGHAGPDFGLRFLLTGLLGGDRVYIDDVKIAGGVAATTTTTTSTSTSSTSTTTPTTTSTEARSSETDETITTTTTTVPAPSSQESDRTPSTGDDLIIDARRGLPLETDHDSETLAGGGEPTEPGPPDGLRVTWVGVVADHPSGLMGQLGGEGTEVLAAELGADFSLAVEVFERARIWISILALMVAAAVIHGIDRHRSPEPAH